MKTWRRKERVLVHDVPRVVYITEKNNKLGMLYTVIRGIYKIDLGRYLLPCGTLCIRFHVKNNNNNNSVHVVNEAPRRVTEPKP